MRKQTTDTKRPEAHKFTEQEHATYERMQKDRGQEKRFYQNSNGVNVSSWGRPSKMEVIVQAFGSHWVNVELGILGIEPNKIHMSHLFEKHGAGKERHDAYKAWKQDAFIKAWEKLKGREPDAYMLACYE